MGNLMGFDVKAVKEFIGFEVMPVDWYEALIHSAEVVDTSKGGKMIKLQWCICSEKYENRRVFENVNIVKPDGSPDENGQARLGAICKSIGFVEKSPSDTEEMLNVLCEIKLGIEPAKDGFPEKNKPIAYRAITTAAPAPAAKKEGALPWKK